MQEPGGIYKIANWLIQTDPYIEFHNLVSLLPPLVSWGNIREQTDAKLRPMKYAAMILPLWLKGAGGAGKSTFIRWFAQHLLGQSVFKHAQSENFKHYI